MEKHLYDEASMDALARAACLTLGENEHKTLARELGNTLAELSALDDVKNEERWQDRAVDLCVLRADETGDCLPRERLLSAAQNRRDGCFAVLGVLDNGGAEDVDE